MNSFQFMYLNNWYNWCYTKVFLSIPEVGFVPSCCTILMFLETEKSEMVLRCHRSQVKGHRSQVTGHRSQVTGHRSQVTGHRSQVTGHRSQVTGHRSQVTGHRSDALLKSVAPNW
jgi:hypothetical protein